MDLHVCFQPVGLLKKICPAYISVVGFPFSTGASKFVPSTPSLAGESCLWKKCTYIPNQNLIDLYSSLLLSASFVPQKNWAAYTSGRLPLLVDQNLSRQHPPLQGSLKKSPCKNRSKKSLIFMFAFSLAGFFKKISEADTSGRLPLLTLVFKKVRNEISKANMPAYILPWFSGPPCRPLAGGVTAKTKSKNMPNCKWNLLRFSQCLPNILKNPRFFFTCDRILNQKPGTYVNLSTYVSLCKNYLVVIGTQPVTSS